MDEEIKVTYRLSGDGWCDFTAEIGGRLVAKERIYGASDDEIRAKAKAMLEKVSAATLSIAAHQSP